MATDILGIVELEENQASPYVTHNEALAHIEAVMIRVLSRTNAGPPATPVNGNTFIVDVAADGWSAFAVDDIAHCSGGGWENYTPIEGQRVWVNDEDDIVDFNGAAWVSRATWKKYISHDLTVPVVNGTWTPATSGVGVFDLTGAVAPLALSLAAPAFAGQELVVNFDTGADALVITGPNDMSGTDDIATLGDDGDWMILVSRKAAGVLEWRIVADDGVVWSATAT